VMLVMTDWRDWALLCVPRWATIKELLRFGLLLWVVGLASFFSIRWDGMLSSRYFGAATLGAYNLAYSLAEMSVAQVGEQVGDVLLPSFAQIEPQKRPQALARAIRLLGFVMFPLGLGLAAVSSSLVRAFFDPRWAIVAPMLAILSALTVTRPFAYAVTSYFQSCSRTMILSILDVSRMLLLVLLMVLAAPYGIYALCIAVGVAFSVATFAGLVVISREGIHLLGLLVGIGRPFAASAMMLVCVLGARYAAAGLGVTRPSMSLIIEVLVGAVTWLIAARLIANQSLMEVIDLARKVVGRGKKPQGEGPEKTAAPS
jgi:lipopolysaccharide exporter